MPSRLKMMIKNDRIAVNEIKVMEKKKKDTGKIKYIIFVTQTTKLQKSEFRCVYSGQDCYIMVPSIH